MKITRNYLLFTIIALVFINCSKKDDNDDNDDIVTPEVITEIIKVELTAVDPLNPNSPVINSIDIKDKPATLVRNSFKPNKTYNCNAHFFNTAASTTKNINDKILEQAKDYEVFYEVSEGLNLTITKNDKDADNNPLGLTTELKTGAPSTGMLKIILKHKPKKPNNGTTNDAGGETTIEFTIDIFIR